METLQGSKSVCLKRKLVDDCQSKENKSRRIKVENGPSFDSSAKACNCCWKRPNVASDCVNYLVSGVPSRVMFYKQGSWHNFPEVIMKVLIEEFSGKKSSVVSMVDGEAVLVDFLSMTLVNLQTRRQRSVAWFDDTGRGFFPSLFFDEEDYWVARVDSTSIENSAQGIMSVKAANSPPEVVKQVVLESDPPDPQKASAVDILRKKITFLERGSEGFLFVQDLFLSGMGPFATPDNILHIHQYAPNDITAQCRLQAFQRQMSSTKERGDSNVRYGWLGSKKKDIVRILINGFGGNEKPAEKAGLSACVFLSPENRAFTSVGLCDVDERGVQYMLLCRMILGNMEAITPGSQDLYPTSEIYDSGVDDYSNPKCYVMWPSHFSSHIRLEYLVSFRLSSKVRNYLHDLKGLWFQPSPKEVTMDISTLQPIMSEGGKAPTSPWISFRVLFGMIQDNISSVARELLFHHYEELKENEITREEMVKKIIIIVGEKLLLESVKKLHYCPSLWCKSSAEVKPSDCARTAAEAPARTAEPISLDETIGNSSLSLGNHGNAHASNALSESSAARGTQGCDSNAVGIVSESHDSLAQSGVPETSTSAGAVCRVSPKVEAEDGDSPVKIVSAENSATRCTEIQDPFVAKMSPIVRDGLLRTASGRSGSLSAEGCSSAAASMRSPGYTSLAPTNALKGHGILASGISPNSCESLEPSLTLGPSKCIGSKVIMSTPKMRPEGQAYLSLSIVPQRPVLHSGKGNGHLTCGAAPPVHAPGHGISLPLSTGGCDSLALSIAPKGHDPPAPSNHEPKCHGAPTIDTVPEIQHAQAPSVTTEGITVPGPTEDSKDQVVQLGPHNKPSGQEAGSNVALAADILIALSTPREKAERESNSHCRSSLGSLPVYMV